MDKHLHDTRPTQGREHRDYRAGAALVKGAAYALLVAVVVLSSVQLGRNNAPMPAIAHAAFTSGTTLDGVACILLSIKAPSY
jgi:hypothetical protein